MLWKKSGKPSVKASDLTAFIDEGSEIEGKCTFGGTVMLNGTVRGEITCTDTVIIGEKGIAHTTIRAGAIVISGQVVGNLIATQRLEMRGAARVFGDIEAPVVVMEEGVIFQGHCQMTPAAGAPTASAAQRDLSVVPLKR
jgi:cytoskeletal protein CcmA (bactofilin family)